MTERIEEAVRVIASLQAKAMIDGVVEDCFLDLGRYGGPAWALLNLGYDCGYVVVVLSSDLPLESSLIGASSLAKGQNLKEVDNCVLPHQVVRASKHRYGSHGVSQS